MNPLVQLGINNPSVCHSEALNLLSNGPQIQSFGMTSLKRVQEELRRTVLVIEKIQKWFV